MNNKFYDLMLERLIEKKVTHSVAAAYYNNLHKLIMYPSIGITALSSIASFVSTSNYADCETQNFFTMSVGICASISTLLQSISSTCNYLTKSELHSTAAQEYNKLITKLQFEIEIPDDKEFVNNMEQKILEIQSKCKLIPPQSIIDNYKNNSLIKNK